MGEEIDVVLKEGSVGFRDVGHVQLLQLPQLVAGDHHGRQVARLACTARNSVCVVRRVRVRVWRSTRRSTGQQRRVDDQLGAGQCSHHARLVKVPRVEQHCNQARAVSNQSINENHF